MLGKTLQATREDPESVELGPRQLGAPEGSGGECGQPLKQSWKACCGQAPERQEELTGSTLVLPELRGQQEEEEPVGGMVCILGFSQQGI